MSATTVSLRNRVLAIISLCLLGLLVLVVLQTVVHHLLAVLAAFVGLAVLGWGRLVVDHRTDAPPSGRPGRRGGRNSGGRARLRGCRTGDRPSLDSADRGHRSRCRLRGLRAGGHRRRPAPGRPGPILPRASSGPPGADLQPVVGWRQGGAFRPGEQSPGAGRRGDPARPRPRPRGTGPRRRGQGRRLSGNGRGRRLAGVGRRHRRASTVCPSSASVPAPGTISPSTSASTGTTRARG